MDVKRALLDAAEHMLADQDFSAFSLRECARLAGVSYTLPAHYFGDRGGLLSQLLIRSYDELARSIRLSIAPYPDDAMMALRLTAKIYVLHSLRDAHIFALIHQRREIDRSYPDLIRAFNDVHALLFNAMFNVVKLRGGLFNRGSIARLNMATSAIFGYLELMLQGDLGAAFVGRGRQSGRMALSVRILIESIIDEMIMILQDEK